MKIIIIGSGPAGVVAAETIRANNPFIDLVMLSAEPYPPYSPPAMLDHFMHSNNAHFWRDPDWAMRMRIDYRSGQPVAAIQPQHRRVSLNSGENLQYDRLLIASGSRLYAPVPGVNLPGVYNFKSLSAATELVDKIQHGRARTALVVGAGFIGMEIALLLCALGVAVTQVEMLDQVMATMLDADIAALALWHMRQRGVVVRLHTKARAFAGNGHAWGVQLESGEILQADLLIAATGVKPNLDFVSGSGLSMRWGLLVDEHLRTNDENIYAAGDAIEAPDLLTGECFVHANFPNAVEQGRVAGLNLAGIPTSYAGAERLNSLKHLGVPIVAAGLKQGEEVLERRVDGTLRKFYLMDKRLVGFQLAGDIRGSGVLHNLLVQQRELGKLKDQLLSPNFGQGTLAWEAITQ